MQFRCTVGTIRYLLFYIKHFPFPGLQKTRNNKEKDTQHKLSVSEGTDHPVPSNIWHPNLEQQQLHRK